MRIAYCEDEAAQAQLVRTMIEQWAECKQEFVEVVLFESAEEFLFKNDDFPYDVVFLDIAMRQINGVELARTIRKKDKRLPIAFLTADKAFAIEGYEVHAVRYLLKPITTEKLESLLDELLAEQENKVEDTICITIERRGIQKGLWRIAFAMLRCLGIIHSCIWQMHLRFASRRV